MSCSKVLVHSKLVQVHSKLAQGSKLELEHSKMVQVHSKQALGYNNNHFSFCRNRIVLRRPSWRYRQSMLQLN